ncbi:MAG TPA: DUF1385 domain-containing protein [Candidatus Latescibacteria bacterium]|jgi:uncharacterized protein YqhQ|nr:hypothetical protein [Gemmatimonadaceae bacterium]MDP6016262.1 DUF1385 domain-containing protein [Candidatus Latescibacterota bacterium]HJP34328.1 DUF1385 domain-containing protein [Candidatus Latescibacterota bacterium]
MAASEEKRTEDLPIGGQAVIEGVMMRADNRIVTAVRTADGQIVVHEQVHEPWGLRLGLRRIPVLRGAVAFIEMMIIGLRTLNLSADVAMQSERQERGLAPAAQTSSGWKDRAALAATLVVSLALGIGVFFFLPLAAAQAAGAAKGALEFNLIAGAVRTTILIGYMWGIGHWSDIRRVFEYHGAEHKSIYTMEAGADLTVAEARDFDRLHPRCGTSFLLIVVLLSIFIFALVDSAFADVFGHAQSLVERFMTHMSVLPLISGISFELLKLSGRKRNHPVTRLLIKPGLWLQRITTKEPADDQIEVALVALRRALGQETEVSYSPLAEWRRSLTEAPLPVPATGGSA